jgi:hypothetical protein
MQAPDLARVVIALAVAMALAVLGAHPRVIRWERRFRLTVVASGETHAGADPAGETAGGMEHGDQLA